MTSELQGLEGRKKSTDRYTNPLKDKGIKPCFREGPLLCLPKGNIGKNLNVHKEGFVNKTKQNPKYFVSIGWNILQSFKRNRQIFIVEKMSVMHYKVLKEITELYEENGYFYRKKKCMNLKFCEAISFYTSMQGDREKESHQRHRSGLYFWQPGEQVLLE